jgi:integrase
MPRPKRPARKQRLTELTVRKLAAGPADYLVWDTLQHGLALKVTPAGAKSWKCIYSRQGRARWLHIGDARSIGLADARRLTAEAMLEVARGKDPAAEKRAERGAGSFTDLATRYVEHYAKKKNKSWRQADALVRAHLLPRWGKLQATSISRADVKAMMARIEAPVVANQTLAAASAIYSWAVREELAAANPCRGIDRNETKSRERVLSDSEVPRFWSAFDDAGLLQSSALKLILLTGQRPGEVSHMRREHVEDGWWSLPGEPVPALGWPGTKNKQTHRVWLPAAAREIIAELGDETDGFVFASRRGGGAITKLSAAMQAVCAKLGVADKVTPHDLRRTFSSKVTGLGFGRDAMNRVTNHREGGIASVYDRHQYADENRRIMETVSANIMSLATGEPKGKVVPIRGY